MDEAAADLFICSNGESCSLELLVEVSGAVAAGEVVSFLQPVVNNAIITTSVNKTLETKYTSHSTGYSMSEV